MIRYAAMLPALMLTLVLGACSKKDTEAAPEGDAVHAAAEAEEADESTEAETAPTPQRKMDYWPIVGPLVAGSYRGTCLRTPDGRNMEATVLVGAEGKASSSGLEVDFRGAKRVTLARTRRDNGDYIAMALLAVDEDRGGMLSLNSGEKGQAGSVTFSRDDTGLACSNVAAADKLNAQPVHRAVAALFDGRKQTLSCLDTKNLLVRRNIDVEVADGVMKVGEASFDLKTAASETVMFDDAGGTMLLSVVMPDGRVASAIYDGAGKLTHFTGRDQMQSTHSCDLKS